MINFFRRIRFDILEKNRTGKYFKYAIGEIVLVVIGILIAINLNNSNEQKGVKKNVDDQLNLLKQSVYKDSITFRSLMNYSVKQIKDAERLIQLLNKPINAENCEEFITKFMSHIEIRTNIVDRAIYDEMVSSAAFSKIDKQVLKSQIATYYQLSDHFDDVIWLHVKDFREFYNLLFTGGTIARYYFDENALITKQKKCDYLQSLIDSKEKKQLLENYFYSGIDTYNLINGLYSELIYRTMTGLPKKDE